MKPPREHQNSDLPRLPSGAYQGDAQVHWSLSIEDRRKGWLDERFHLIFREHLLHTASRYKICCPIYCCMPDHLHLLWLGTHERSDQRPAMKFFRKQINFLLKAAPSAGAGGFVLQKQAYDHVFRESQRDPQAFAEVANYIRLNPVRAGICQHPEEYPFTGCVIPGYPELQVHTRDYWKRLWKVMPHLRSTSD